MEDDTAAAAAAATKCAIGASRSTAGEFVDGFENVHGTHASIYASELRCSQGPCSSGPEEQGISISEDGTRSR